MQEDLKVVPYNPALTKMFGAHINVERTQGGGAVAYLKKYAFKPPAPKEVRLQTRDDTRTEQPSSNIIVQNDIRAYMQARAVGPVEGCWRLFEFRHVKIHPNVETRAIHLPGERTVLIRSPRLPRVLKSSTLEGYLV